MTRDPRVNPLVGRAARNAETQIRYRGKGGGRVSGRTRGFDRPAQRPRIGPERTRALLGRARAPGKIVASFGGASLSTRRSTSGSPACGPLRTNAASRRLRRRSP